MVGCVKSGFKGNIWREKKVQDVWMKSSNRWKSCLQNRPSAGYKGAEIKVDGQCYG